MQPEETVRRIAICEAGGWCEIHMGLLILRCMLGRSRWSGAGPGGGGWCSRVTPRFGEAVRFDGDDGWELLVAGPWYGVEGSELAGLRPGGELGVSWVCELWSLVVIRS